MTTPSTDDEIIREFATIARRLSRAIREGRVMASRRTQARRSAAEIVKQVPERSRRPLVEAVRWAQADAYRDRAPEAARDADRQLRERGYSVDGPSRPHSARTEVEDELRAALAERTSQLSALRQEHDAQRAADRDASRSLREELTAETGMSRTAAGAVMAGAMIAAAIDEEAEQSLATAATDEQPSAEAAAQTAQASDVERTVSIDDLITDAHPIALSDKLAAGAESVTEASTEPPQLDAGQEASVDMDAEMSV